ncbi:MAG: type III-B CRISPR module RAMP protein Cmr6 [Symploca sp. SIO1C2]|nr:type III-B CRISPR module RAMP protein Cmr6 [Symploca sp. SIO1C2]
MVFERPKKLGKPQPKRPATPPKRNIDKPKNGGRNGGNGDPPPSPWLNCDDEPNPTPTASFVEYLRWMREPDSDYKDPTKVQILQMAQEGANYSVRLTQLNKRTELIAGKGNSFQVKCPWRIRVGGHRGPENILLPAFDALGMPYIPSSTLRGVARNQAIREVMKQEKLDWKEAEKHPKIAKHFGSLEAEDAANREGKVIFLDAYPLPNQGELVAMDMANNIWNWEGKTLDYNPNPNPFLSLKEPTFLIGLRLTSRCEDTEILRQVREWLIAGLQSGIGSQVNTGYGQLIKAGKVTPKDEFYRLEFTLEGQLIHGRQKFTRWNWSDSRHQWQTRGLAEAEVRPVAFKSMLRYWFRMFALGVLEPSQAQDWEAKLFGAINPKQRRGWVKVSILNGRVTQREPRSNYQGKDDDCGEQQGILTLAFSEEAAENDRDAIAKLFKTLTWMMFHLGGIGQGARRPCYSRKNRDRAPWYRGSTLIPESDEEFWELPDTVTEFRQLFQRRLQEFYTALGRLFDSPINYHSPKSAGNVRQDTWIEAVDSNCKIVVCAGKEDFGKPYALAVLHSKDLKVPDRRGKQDYDGNLCGTVSRKVKPSPVWIVDLGDYQVVTVFGATQNPRKRYLEELRRRTSRANYDEIWRIQR